MSPLNRHSISQKLIRLDRLIGELELISKTPQKVFMLDQRLQAATERYFILAIEIITDIGNHLLVQKVGKAGDSYEKIIEEIGRQKIVPTDLAERNKTMAGFRNILVHVYDEVDPKLVFRYVKESTAEFRAFAKAFAKFLK